ncbi:MAG: response regulator transcription factor [Actinomycetaceae bacterium]|nr:response regulator transcription factor [Actinomycetaceae bacterium]
MKRIVVVEDQLVLLDSLARALEAEEDFEVVATLQDPATLPQAVEKNNANMVLMDVCTVDGPVGLEAAAKLNASHPDVTVVLMTAMPDVTFVDAAKQAGVTSFVYKNIHTSELLSILRSSANDYSIYPPEPKIPALGYNELSEREIEVLRLVCAGFTRKEIADRMTLSENTIKSNISSILTKTGYQSIARLALYALSSGFIVVDQVAPPTEG